MKEENAAELLAYQPIDLIATGKRLKELAEKAGLSVRKIQYCLQLAYPQPIYRWYRGEILPSINHLYMLSLLLDVHMEDLLVLQGEEASMKDHATAQKLQELNDQNQNGKDEEENQG